MPEFIGSCDRIRQTPKGEAFWRESMESRKEITEAEFLFQVRDGIKKVLDEDETWDDYKSTTSDEIRYYKSPGGVYFFQTAGFEFFWRIKEQNTTPPPLNKTPWHSGKKHKGQTGRAHGH